tara:strand:+ start:531 stop:1160 length:630 start_codon:yes stop_codon:yes gene_type:complete
LGPGQYTGTAAELNQVNTNLSAFNGRTVRDVVPTEGDYTMNLLGDVDTTTTAPVSGDFLVFDGANWVPGVVFPAVEVWRGFGAERPSTRTNVPEVSTQIESTINSLGTVTNSSSDGWYFIADVRCKVDISYFGNALSGANNGYVLNDSTNDTIQNVPIAQRFNNFGGSAAASSLSIILEPTDRIEMRTGNGVMTSAGFNLSLVVQQVAA